VPVHLNRFADRIDIREPRFRKVLADDGYRQPVQVIDRAQETPILHDRSSGGVGLLCAAEFEIVNLVALVLALVDRVEVGEQVRAHVLHRRAALGDSPAVLDR
jgi:hypothetical protein